MKSLFPQIFATFTTDKNNQPKRIDVNEPVEFEDAVSLVPFGKYNIFLMCFMLMVSLAFIFDTTSMSYIVPSAECDLQLSLINKGLLNAIVHVGMITSAFFTGYLADTIGRKAILFGGLLFDAFFNILSTFSHSFELTLVSKFFAGFFMAGITTVQMTMMAEFHSSKYRKPITMYIGLTFSFAMLGAPFIAWLILTKPQDLLIGTYKFHSWQMYLGACSLPGILASLCFYLVPESPKFLASKNRNEEALKVLKKIYSINSGKPVDTFPVKMLKSIGEKSDKENFNEDDKQVGEGESNDVNKRDGDTPRPNVHRGRLVEFLQRGKHQLAPLFLQPHLLKLLLLFALQFIGVWAQNSIRLWLPQLFQMMSQYGDENAKFCDMISLGNKTIVDKPEPLDGVCHPINVAPETYLNSMIVASVQVAFGTVTSLTINYIGRKTLLVLAMFLSGVCTIGLYWSYSQAHVTTLASLSVALSVTSINCLLSTNVDLFPTALRAMALSLTLMVGRIGSITGNMLFPVLLSLGCLPPFLTIACGLFGGSILSIFIPLPNENTK